jgi:hypothetical protein
VTQYLSSKFNALDSLTRRGGGKGRSWGHSSVGQHVLSVPRALASISGIKKKSGCHDAPSRHRILC